MAGNEDKARDISTIPYSDSFRSASLSITAKNFPYNPSRNLKTSIEIFLDDSISLSIIISDQLGDDRLVHDRYFFDENGNCTKHIYSRRDVGRKVIVEEKEDEIRDLNVLVGHGYIFTSGLNYLKRYISEQSLRQDKPLIKLVEMMKKLKFN